MHRTEHLGMDTPMAPREAQIAVYEKGLIPCISADRKEAIKDDAE